MTEMTVEDHEKAVKDAEAALAAAKAKRDFKEFPAWVVPHDSHIERRGDVVSVPHFPDFHVARDGVVTVLVRDAEHEAQALASKVTK